MPFPFIFGRKKRNPDELNDLDYIKAIGQGRTSGSISRKLGIDRKSAEEALERLRAVGLVGLYSDSGTWFVTSDGENELKSTA